MIKIRFFASLREHLDTASLNFEVNDEKTVADIKQQLVSRGEKWQFLSERDVLCAVNQTLTGEDAIVNDGDELAFFPPVTGG